MKKIKLILSVLLLGLAVSCEDTPNDNKDDGPKEVQYIKYSEQYLGPLGTPSLERALINKFNETHEYIQVEYSSEAEADVILAKGDYISSLVGADLALDISEFTSKDNQWNNVIAPLRDSVTYKNKVYAVPMGQYFSGYLVNHDLVDKVSSIKSQDVFKPEGYSLESFLSTINDTKNYSEEILAVSGMENMIDWMPSSLDSENKLKYFMFDGEKFDFTNQHVINSIDTISKLSLDEAKVFGNLYETEELEKLYGTFSTEDIFINGKMCFYQVPLYSNPFANSIKFNYEFIPCPNNTVISLPTYLYISSNCENKEAAYELIKFMSFGLDGINVRKELYEKYPNLITGLLPATNNFDDVSELLDVINIPGMKKVYESVCNNKIEVLVECNQYVPNYNMARFNYSTKISYDNVAYGIELNMMNYIYQVCLGNISLDEYKKHMSGSLGDNINNLIYDGYNEIE